MEALAGGRDAAAGSSPTSKQELAPYAGAGAGLKPNQVGETSLYGVPIVSLVIDGQERLCLAQISNTLLKSYSYNEIHNRRVALGITCVQCTPVQLEILRRAGAMPISSRRCGMITKREAERLCKSFLGEHKPPKLPENFAFDVAHECAWGSRGSFIPARYNSSRAKCIKCSYCAMYFSPNKFIFHSHRTPDAKYTQPDAANFNSWRRHLKLSDKAAGEELCHAWEDVKAMFNGGTRKRTFSVPPAKPPPPPAADLPPAHKSLRADEPAAERAALGLAGPAAVRSYPVIPVPSKGFGVLQKLPPPLFPHPYGFPAAAFGLCPKKPPDEAAAAGGGGGGGGAGEPGKGPALAPGMFWGPPAPPPQPPPPPPPPQGPPPAAKDGAVYPAFPMFWPAAGSLPVPPFPAPKAAAAEPEGAEPPGSGRSSAAPPEPEAEPPPRADEADELLPLLPLALPLPRKGSYLSAFRPVVKDAESIAKLYGTRDGYAARGLSPGPLSEGSASSRSLSPGADTADEPEVDVESGRFPDDDDDDDEEAAAAAAGGERAAEPAEPPGAARPDEAPAERPGRSPEVYERDEAPQARKGPYLGAPEADQGDNPPGAEEPDGRKPGAEPRAAHPSPGAERGEEGLSPDGPGAALLEKDIENLARDELQKLLLEQVELRKKLEREFQSLKDNFQDQMKRELAYREEMVQQLQIVRDTLCNELDQERKARYAIQQKLKEAHDALHHFSCKMLTPRHCSGNCSFKPPLLPQ